MINRGEEVFEVNIFLYEIKKLKQENLELYKELEL